MARGNKYAAVNFNDIYDKKSSSSSSAPLQKPQFAAVTRNNGRMLVLTRPSPKPQQPSPPPPPSLQSQPHPQPLPVPHADQTLPEPDSISLRPLGRTGSVTLPPFLSQERFNKDPSPPLKPDRFVPPHLRPGFVPRKESPPEFLEKQPGFQSREFGRLGSPKSDLMVNRPGSGGSRPSSSR